MSRPVRSSVGLPSLAVLTVVAFLAGCNDDGTGSGLTIQDLAGTWLAQSVVFRSQANPALSVDLIDLGATATLQIVSTGRYTLTSTFPEEAPEVEMGDADIVSGGLRLDPDGNDEDPVLWAVTLNGNMFTAETDDVDFDVDLNGQDEAAILTVVFVKS
jgi:hypothetical protein